MLQNRTVESILLGSVTGHVQVTASLRAEEGVRGWRGGVSVEQGNFLTLFLQTRQPSRLRQRLILNEPPAASTIGVTPSAIAINDALSDVGRPGCRLKVMVQGSPKKQIQGEEVNKMRKSKHKHLNCAGPVPSAAIRELENLILELRKARQEAQQ